MNRPAPNGYDPNEEWWNQNGKAYLTNPNRKPKNFILVANQRVIAETFREDTLEQTIATERYDSYLILEVKRKHKPI